MPDSSAKLDWTDTKPVDVTPDGNGVVLEHPNGGQAVVPRDWVPNLKLDDLESRQKERNKEPLAESTYDQPGGMLDILSKANATAEPQATAAAPPGTPPQQESTPVAGGAVAAPQPPPTQMPPVDIRTGKPVLPTMANVSSEAQGAVNQAQEANQALTQANVAANTAQLPVTQAAEAQEQASLIQQQAAQKRLEDLAAQHLNTGLQRADEIHQQATKADNYMGWWDNMDTGAKVVAAFGLLISGYDGANKFIQNNVKNWGEAQRAKYDQLKGTQEAEDTIYGQAKSLGLADEDAIKFTEAQGMKMVGALGQRIANQTKNPILNAQGAQAAAGLSKEGADTQKGILVADSKSRLEKAQAGLAAQQARLTGLQADWMPIAKQMEIEGLNVKIPTVDATGKPHGDVTVLAKDDKNLDELKEKLAAHDSFNDLIQKAIDYNKSQGTGLVNRVQNLATGVAQKVPLIGGQSAGRKLDKTLISELSGNAYTLSGKGTSKGPMAQALVAGVQNLHSLLDQADPTPALLELRSNAAKTAQEAIVMHTRSPEYQQKYGQLVKAFGVKHPIGGKVKRGR